MNPWASRFSIVVCCLTLCGAVFSTILLPDSLAALRIVLDIVNIIAGVLLCGFIFFSTYNKNIKFLKLAFWLVIAQAIFLLVVLLISTVTTPLETDRIRWPAIEISSGITICTVVLCYIIRDTISTIETDYDGGPVAQV